MRISTSKLGTAAPPANYLSHHLAGIVTAAVFADAAHIVKEIVLLKTRVNERRDVGRRGG